MSTAVIAAALAERIDPLDEEEQRMLHEYWDNVIREELVPGGERRPVPDALSVAEERRVRRETRRRMATVAAAGRAARRAAAQPVQAA
jgi:hypothetical protein